MTSHSTGRGLALVAGILATSGALAILLQDAIRTGDWTIEHGLIPVLMAVQILTGHLFVAAARQRKALPALGFALVATGAWSPISMRPSPASRPRPRRRLRASSARSCTRCASSRRGRALRSRSRSPATSPR